MVLYHLSYLCIVAGAGLEHCDLWVMSPTSYQLLHPANFFIVAVERFERPNTGVRVLCLTSLAKRQYSSHKRIRTPTSPCSQGALPVSYVRINKPVERLELPTNALQMRRSTN